MVAVGGLPPSQKAWGHITQGEGYPDPNHPAPQPCQANHAKELGGENNNNKKHKTTKQINNYNNKNTVKTTGGKGGQKSRPLLRLLQTLALASFPGRT